MNTEQDFFKKTYSWEEAHALKEQINELQIENAHLIAESERAQQNRENPQPLTLDELKERVGKPVWIAVEENEQGEPSCWAIVGSEWKNENGVELHSLIKDDGGAYEYYGKTWTAYDHEPKEGE